MLSGRYVFNQRDATTSVSTVSSAVTSGADTNVLQMDGGGDTQMHAYKGDGDTDLNAYPENGNTFSLMYMVTYTLYVPLNTHINIDIQQNVGLTDTVAKNTQTTMEWHPTIQTDGAVNLSQDDYGLK